jgi:beta-glucosidase
MRRPAQERGRDPAEGRRLVGKLVVGVSALDELRAAPGFGIGYSELQAEVAGRAADETLAVAVTCTVANGGQRRGKEVVQLYVSSPAASVARPPRELKGFAKLDLAPGERDTVRFRLGARDLSYWSTAASDWVLEPGEYRVAVGASSRDLRQTTPIDVAALPLRPRLDHMATLQEWLADPTGSVLLREAVGTDDDGRPRGILGNDELLAIIVNFPISTLAAFPGLGLDHATIDHVLRRISAQPH